MTPTRFPLTALVTIALPVSVLASSLALTPADSGTMGQAEPGGGWGIHIPTLSFVFQVSTPIDVTALGYYFYTDNPLGGEFGVDSTHSLTLTRWNGVSLDAPLASTNVALGSPVFQSSINHRFSYANIAPVALTLGNTYVLSATGSDVGDFFYQTSNYGPAPEIVFIESLHGSSTPTGGTNAASNCFGPDLFYTPTVPEPSPRLNITFSGAQQVRVTWNTNRTDYALESASTLPAVSWEPVTNGVFIAGQPFTVTVDYGEARRFFRLRKN